MYQSVLVWMCTTTCRILQKCVNILLKILLKWDRQEVRLYLAIELLYLCKKNQYLECCSCKYKFANANYCSDRRAKCKKQPRMTISIRAYFITSTLQSHRKENINLIFLHVVSGPETNK